MPLENQALIVLINGAIFELFRDYQKYPKVSKFNDKFYKDSVGLMKY